MAGACAALWAVAGCARLHPAPPKEMVYVVARNGFLRERVAAVSNKVAAVQNGEPLQVLEHGRRFLKVKTAKGEVGWIEDRQVIDQQTFDAFNDLKKQHADDPVVGTAILRDELYMHLTPGRDTERFFLLPENARLQLLVRASVPKTPAAAGFATRRSAKATVATKPPDRHEHTTAIPTDVAPPGPPPAEAQTPLAPENLPGANAPPVPLEDWWLVRDTEGHVGWLVARRLDVDVPDSIAGYAEGQKMVGAYVLATVNDPESAAPNKQVPEYVAVLNHYQDGLPYDFDQVRVFTWNTKKHRYETAFRQRNIEGFLPVSVTNETIDGQRVPVFSFKVATAHAPTTDPQTGAPRPTETATERFEMQGVMVKRIADGTQAAPLAATPVKTAEHTRHRHGRR